MTVNNGPYGLFRYADGHCTQKDFKKEHSCVQ